MNKFAVFDIDGTLIRWQLYHAVVDKLAKQGKLNKDAHQKIHTARMRWKNREPQYGFHDYEAELIRQFEAALQKLQPSDFNQVVDGVVSEYKDQAYTYTRDLMKDLKMKGYLLLAISGSQQELVARLAQHYGFDDYIGTSYITDKKGYTGEKIFAAQDKKAALNSLIKKYNLALKDSHAVGDSKSDAAMLEMVENPIAFNPDAQLYKIATENHWQIVIERKNVIYRLEYKNGSYVLAETN